MNRIFFFLIVSSFAFAAYNQIGWVPENPEDLAPMAALSQAVVDSAKSAVELALGLVGVMAFFLGLMKIAEKGGMLEIISKLLRPIMIRLFPDVPLQHPAMGAMIMNISANVLGLANAATPFGIKAMQELNTLNKEKGVASNAMILFLAINTSSVTLLPSGVIALRASMGSQDAAGILPTTLFATACSTIIAILAAKFFQRFSAAPAIVTSQEYEKSSGEDFQSYPSWVSYLAIGGFISLIPLSIFFGKTLAPWMLPGIILFFLLFGWLKKVPVYEAMVEGAKDGFQVAIVIIPYLVTILVSVAMFRASGGLDALITPLAAITELINLPAEALPMALLRPLSGQGAYGVLAATIQDPAIGPDSYIGYLVSTFMGSTETTFYVLAVYFGAVQVKKIRHGIATALSADLAGILAAVFICSILYT